VSAPAILEARNLSRFFDATGRWLSLKKPKLHAVDGISFDIPPGKSLALVGESGCGKTTTGRIVAGLCVPDSGSLVFGGKPMDFSDASLRKSVQMIFQDPYESLNPRMTIGQSLQEPLQIQKIGSRAERRDRVERALEEMGLVPVAQFVDRYPHELSGGQRQRVAIARAFILDPEFVVADEPTSMLDVSIRAEMSNRMLRMAEQRGVSFLYITHDIAIARYMAAQIAIMYLGKIVERGDTESVLSHPLHPYTRALLEAVPTPDPAALEKDLPIQGSLSKPVDPPPFCRFFDRCVSRQPSCKEKPHPNLEQKATRHFVACYLA